MKNVKTSLLIAATAVLPFAASANTAWHTVNNDKGIQLGAGHTTSDVSRTQAIQAAASSRQNPVENGLWVYVGGDRGWETKQHAYVFRDGKLVHADSLPHNTPRANLNLTAADRLAFNEQSSAQ